MSVVDAPLTRTQQQMFIMAELPMYRVPVVFALPASWSDTQVSRQFAKAVRGAPTLQARYEYSLGQESFRQTFVPVADEDLRLQVREIEAPIEVFCATPSLKPDIRRSYPWKASILRAGDLRWLWVEFHHICVDGPGVALFESLLLTQSMPGADPDVRKDFDMYTEVARREEIAFAELLQPARRRSRQGELKNIEPRLGRRRHYLSPQGTHFVAEQARSLRVTVRCIYQAAFELALESADLVAEYALVSSWRWTLGRNAVGSFPALIAQQPATRVPFNDRARSLFQKLSDPRIAPTTRFARNPAAVFSFESFAFDVGEFVPVDSYPKFDLYVRLSTNDSGVFIEIETDRQVVSDVVRDALLKNMIDQLELAPELI